MARFSYRGRDLQGEAVVGEQEAGDADQLAGWLQARQITPVSITPLVVNEEGAASRQVGEISWLQRVSLEELILFSRQMHSLSKAGVPIIRAIRGLASSSRNLLLARTLGCLADDLEKGLTLSASLARHPRVFSRLYVSLIHVGENTGDLDQAFGQIAQYLQVEQQTRRRLKEAVRYPLFVLTAIGLALVVINIFVIPAFADVFAKLHADLPWQTQVLVQVSDFLRHYGIALLVLLILAAVAGWRYVQTQAGALRWDRIKLSLPLVGSFFRRTALGRFARSFALVLRAGIPVEQGLNIVAGAVGNSHIGAQVQSMRQGIERGEGLTRIARKTEMFSPLVMQMLAVGEETGNLDDMLLEVADFYEQEVEYDLKSLSSAIEPLLILGVAGLVLILALGVFLPLWELSGALNV